MTHDLRQLVRRDVVEHFGLGMITRFHAAPNLGWLIELAGPIELDLVSITSTERGSSKIDQRQVFETRKHLRRFIAVRSILATVVPDGASQPAMVWLLGPFVLSREQVAAHRRLRHSESDIGMGGRLGPRFWCMVAERVVSATEIGADLGRRDVAVRARQVRHDCSSSRTVHSAAVVLLRNSRACARETSASRGRGKIDRVAVRILPVLAMSAPGSPWKRLSGDQFS